MYHLFYQPEAYAGSELKAFPDEAAMLKFVNERATQDGFYVFKVIVGTAYEFEPVEMVKQYRVKR